MYKVKMEKATINNIKVFLDRITLTPKEIPAYLDIIQALDKAEKIQEKEGD